MEKRSRILVMCYEFPPLGGGGAKVVHGMARELIKAGHSVDLVTMGYRGLPKEEVVDGINVYRVPCIRLKKSMCFFPEMIPYILTAFLVALKLVKKNNYDINHSHFIFPDGLISFLLFKIAKLPYVITAHGSDVPGYNPNRFKLLHVLLLPFWKCVTKNAAKLICPSRTIERLILKSNGKVKTQCIPNGIERNRFDGNQKKKNRILVVTRMFERKGVQHFLEAIRDNPFDVEINVVGDGPYLKTIRRIQKEKNIRANIVGFLDNKSSELKELYETSRIFVFPSEAENFPIVLLEAMVAGMAIITTKNTGCAEVVGNEAVLVEPRDVAGIRQALEALVSNPEKCHELGQAARKRVINHFSWDAVIRQTSDVYDTIRKQGVRGSV